LPETRSISLPGGKDRLFQVEATSPPGGVIINQKTKFILKKPDFSLEAPSHISYEDVGGLERELRLVREMVELPCATPKSLKNWGLRRRKAYFSTDLRVRGRP